MPSPIDPHGPQVAGAIARLQADPNLSAEETVRRLQWAGERQEPDGHGLEWLLDLFEWISQSGRMLMWLGALALAALLALYLFRLVRHFRRRSDMAGEMTPSHVRDLDIRPESLPADVGAAAQRLWESGEHRAALALLYRGLLSRLVHVHGLPIREFEHRGRLSRSDRHPSRAVSK